MTKGYGRDTQRTIWHLTSAWLSGTERQREVICQIANRLGLNDVWQVKWLMPRALFPEVKVFW